MDVGNSDISNRNFPLPVIQPLLAKQQGDAAVARRAFLVVAESVVNDLLELQHST
jgi:hypothetical protein